MMSFTAHTWPDTKNKAGFLFSFLFLLLFGISRFAHRQLVTSASLLLNYRRLVLDTTHRASRLRRIRVVYSAFCHSRPNFRG